MTAQAFLTEYKKNHPNMLGALNALEKKFKITRKEAHSELAKWAVSK